MKLIEVKQAKEFASTFFNDPILKMAANAVLDNAPGFELVRCKDCRFWVHEFDNVGQCNYAGIHLDHADYGFCSYGERRTE